MLTNYIKIAWKVLLRHPFYTFITLFGISLTLTVLMVLTSFIDHLIGTHYPEPNRNRSLYIMNMKTRDSTDTGGSSGLPSYNFLKKYAATLKTPEKVSITSFVGFANTYVNNKRIKLYTKFTDSNFWEVTQFSFLEGKPYNQQNIDNGDLVAVISDAFKKSYFGDEESVIGKTIEVDNARYRVSGVVKAVPVTRPFTSADVYFPYNIPKSNYRKGDYRGQYAAIVLAHSRDDFAAIQDEYNQAVKQIRLPFQDEGMKVFIIHTSADTYLSNFLKGISNDADDNLFFIITGLIMLMFMLLPTINLINLNVSRIMERASEIGIRKAFGAPSTTLLGQFVIENIFITAIGGAIALGFSSLVILLINNSGWIAHTDLTINFNVFAVSMLICLVFGILSGVVPAWRMSKLPVAVALKNT